MFCQGFLRLLAVFSLKVLLPRRKVSLTKEEEYLQNKTAAKTAAWSLVMVTLLLQSHMNSKHI